MKMMRFPQLCLILGVISCSPSDAWLFKSTPSAGGSCYAPPIVFGGKCQSSTSLFGSPGWTITYKIEPTGNVPSLLCCQAVGCGGMYQSQCSGAFGLRDIGCASGSSLTATLPWGNNLANPAIKWKGVPTGMFVRWSH